MNDKIKIIREIVKEINEALWSFEIQDDIEDAYKIYLDAEINLQVLEIRNDEPGMPISNVFWLTASCIRTIISAKWGYQVKPLRSLNVK